MHDVVVVGAGPVGILTAAELARHGADVVVVERNGAPSDGWRAIGVHAPVLAALEPSGITERLLARAQRVRLGEARAGGRLLGIVRFDGRSTRFPFVATLPQLETHAALAVGAPDPVRGEVVRIRLERDAVRVTVSTPGGEDEVRARLVVLAGGPRSRQLAYPSHAVRARTYPDRFVMADVPAAGSEHAIVHLDARGVLESFPMPGSIRRFVAPAVGDEDAAARVAVLQDALRVRGEDAAADAVHAATGFGIRRALAPRMRRDRVFVVGDAAHEVSPMGGQGMNLGLLDAAGLAPLLTQWLRTGVEPTTQLAAWERRRRVSARISSAIATGNTLLGRPASPVVHGVRRRILGTVLHTPAATLFAHAYAMGFDRGA